MRGGDVPLNVKKLGETLIQVWDFKNIPSCYSHSVVLKCVWGGATMPLHPMHLPMNQGPVMQEGFVPPSSAPELGKCLD